MPKSPRKRPHTRVRDAEGYPEGLPVAYRETYDRHFRPWHLRRRTTGNTFRLANQPPRLTE